MVRLATPEIWRTKADECCAQAELIRDPDARRALRQIALMYNAMALRLEQRLAEGQIPQPGFS
jgi:O-methyltransferase involved in polyketide biosynthesis